MGVTEGYLSLSTTTDNLLAVLGAGDGRRSHTVGVVEDQHQATGLRGEDADLPIVPGCDRP